MINWRVLLSKDLITFFLLIIGIEFYFKSFVVAYYKKLIILTLFHLRV